MQPTAVVDIAIIGAGVVGTAIARELSKYELEITLIEKESDVGEGSSKGNSAILHTGFDAKVGTLEARLVREGSALFRDSVAPELGIPFDPIGALVVARNDAERSQLPGIVEKANQNGIHKIRMLSAEEVYAKERGLVAGIKGAVFVEQEGITCPFTPPIAYATQAILNGVELLLGANAKAIKEDEDGFLIQCDKVAVRSRYLINAAGLFSDQIDRALDIEDFEIRPRRGEFIVFDKRAKRRLNHILLQVPTPKTKGILISPTIFGNVLLGPTADDIDDRFGVATTKAGLEKISRASELILPGLLDEEITTTYSGVRAATQYSDYQIHLHPARNYITVGGIRSTGLTSALAIARYVKDALESMGLVLSEKANWRSLRMPNLGENCTRPYLDEQRVRDDPRFGHLICFCEKVSLGEIEDSLSSPIPPTGIHSLKKRTRAAMGRCQGFNCVPRLCGYLAKSRGLGLQEFLQNRED